MREGCCGDSSACVSCTFLTPPSFLPVRLPAQAVVVAETTLASKVEALAAGTLTPEAFAAQTTPEALNSALGAASLPGAPVVPPEKKSNKVGPRGNAGRGHGEEERSDWHHCCGLPSCHAPTSTTSASPMPCVQVAVGVGIGIGLGVPLVGGAAFAYWYYTKKARSGSGVLSQPML